MKRYTKQMLMAILLVAYAVLFNIYGRYAAPLFLNKLFNFVRTFAYMGLFAVWGVSVSRRVMQSEARRLLIGISVLMVFWLGVREFKFRFVLNPVVLRHLWYCYYVPILMIPTLVLLVTMTLHRSERWRLPGWTWLLYFPPMILIVLVMTNDLHQWGFVFPQGSAWSEREYAYGPVIYLTMGWDLLCSGAALLMMFIKCRVPKSKKRIWLPAVLVGLFMGYVVLYAVDMPIVRRIGWDMAVSQCLLFAACLESCIVCGLIPSNTRYYDFFHAIRDISMQIMDNDYNTYYSSGKAEPIACAYLKAAEQDSVMLPMGRLLRNMPIRGGHAVWTEDISALLQIRNTLEERQEELSERQSLLRLEYEKEKNHRTVTEQNRLYDLLQDQTQSQLDRIEALACDYRCAVSEWERRRILTYIVVLGTFVKRRKDFVLLSEASQGISVSHLRDAFAESFHALSLLNIRGGYLIDIGSISLSDRSISLAYDFFEDVLETVLDKVNAVNVRVAEVNGTARINMMTDCPPDTAILAAKYPRVRVICDDDGAEAILPLMTEGGTAV